MRAENAREWRARSGPCRRRSRRRAERSSSWARRASTIASTSCILALCATIFGMAVASGPGLRAESDFPRAVDGRSSSLCTTSAHLGERERLQHVVAGAGFHGLDGGFDRAVGGHDDDRQTRHSVRFAACRNSRPLMPGSFRSVRTRCDWLGREQLQSGFRVAGRERLEAVVAQVQLEQAAHLGFVFDDENGWHRSLVGRPLVVPSFAICCIRRSSQRKEDCEHRSTVLAHCLHESTRDDRPQSSKRWKDPAPRPFSSWSQTD